VSLGKSNDNKIVPRECVTKVIKRIRIMSVWEPECKNQFENFIRSEELIETVPSLAGLSPNFGDRIGSIYYGTGIATPNQPSIGLPFDTLQMILLSEKIRRVFGFGSVYHHIADTHAKTNSWADPTLMDYQAQNTKALLEGIVRNLNLDNFNIVLSSSFDQTQEYLELLNKFRSSNKHNYVKREMADMEWYRVKHNVNLKAGWIISAKETKLGSDERLFDEEYKRIIGTENMSFIYTKPGRTFDANRPKVSPYIQTPGEHRIIIKPNEDVVEKIVKYTNLNSQICYN
jgi:hypothetical protein